MKKHNIKKNIVLSSIVGVTTTTSALAVGISGSNMMVNKNLLNLSTSNTFSADSTTEYPIYESHSNGQNSFLSTKAGPLIYSNNLITALNWFGGKRWEINMEYHTGLKDGDYGNTDWRRSWYNWDYDQNRDILWVLSYGSSGSKKNPKYPQQKIFAFKGSDGTLIDSYDLEGQYTEYKFITALVSGNVLIYGGATSSYDASVQIYDASLKKVKKINGNSDENLTLPEQFKNSSKWYFFNIIPIAENKNIVEIMNFPKTPQKNDNGKNYASYQIDFLLVDDNLNYIKTESSNMWSKQVKVVDNGVIGYRNTQNTPQRDFYTLLDGKVVTILYNTIVIIDPNHSSGASVKTYQVDKTNTNWVLSWTFDTNENLYFKYRNGTKIYKVKASELKNNDSNEVSPLIYYSLEDADPSISKYAKNYILYNVYGYQGQIMLINSWYEDKVLIRTPTEEQKQQQYGMAVAIVENKNSEDYGDVKGILNGKDSFQSSADFYINENILKTKLPSEITKNDLTITNDGFLTQNKTLENNELKYNPFKISNINDKNGTFTITAHIDQIPWFANTLPSNSIPTKIVKEYNNSSSNGVAQVIESKVSWKQLGDNNYDFKNTLPSKVQVSDINNFDPFQVSFNSQVILDTKGNQLYPRKTYSIKSTDDKTGKIGIEVNYEYVPLGITYKNLNDVISYKMTHDYEIYSENKNPEFYFAGSSQKADVTTNNPIDIKSVPQLKTLSQSNLLPSSFAKMENASFEQFVNTNNSSGYPLSRMNFDIDANDLTGTLTITATLQDGYYANKPSVPTKFVQVYTGLNKSDSYNFAFKTQATSINNTAFSSILPSSVNEGDVVKELITYSGFNSADFSVNLFPDNGNGKLLVEIILDKNYANELGNSNGFTDYKISYEFSGFMTTENYNNQYSIVFKSNNDASLAEIKQMTLNEINQAFTNNENDQSKYIEVNGEKYNNLEDFIQGVLIEYSGEKIPKEKWSTNPNIDATMTFDNNAGTMNILLTVKKEALKGLDSDLNIVASYSGFSKGNINVTKDNLSFIDNDLLKSIVKESNDTTASIFAKWVESSNENLRKIISHVSGVYDSLITKKQYKLELVSNDSYGTLSITIVFDRKDVPDEKSLTSYSIQYNI